MKVNAVVNILSIILIILGASGMLYCLPFLYSSRIEDIVGAGLPFVGGTILVSSGLISLSIISINK